jgi:hypothetical protein
VHAFWGYEVVNWTIYRSIALWVHTNGNVTTCLNYWNPNWVPKLKDFLGYPSFELGACILTLWSCQLNHLGLQFYGSTQMVMWPLDLSYWNLNWAPKLKNFFQVSSIWIGCMHFEHLKLSIEPLIGLQFCVSTKMINWPLGWSTKTLIEPKAGR